ncbi:MAG: hypothetical protein ACM31L_03395 [Actinomycetota bacterium]
MRILTALVAAAAMAAGAAAAADKIFGVDVAKPGVRLAEFRYGAHPAGTKVVCSGDPDQPAGVERTPLTLPKSMDKAKVSRCALFALGKDGLWTPRPVELVGTPSESWLMAIEDDDRVERVYQVYLRQPHDVFSRTVAAFVERFGDPAERDQANARWRTPAFDVMATQDKDSVQVFMVEPRLQALMQARMEAKRGRK